MSNRRKTNPAVLSRGLLLLFAACAIGACDKQTVYHNFHSLPGEGWNKQDTVVFDVAVCDSQTHYRLDIEIRNTARYPYQDIGLGLCYCGPGISRTTTDSLHYILADRQGHWKGEGWGGLYQTSFPAGTVRIDSAGTYHFRLVHTLPDETLQGINDIGIRLVRQAGGSYPHQSAEK